MSHSGSAHRIPVKRGRNSIYFLRASEIRYIEGANQYVRIHTAKDSYLVRESLSALEEKLDSTVFMRIHRSTLVNLDLVQEILIDSPKSRWVVLSQEERLRVSQGYWRSLQRRLAG